jgi:acetolactate synthase-1/2/3 large subunit
MDVKGSTSLVRCLEAEGVKHVFGIPGEENLDLMDSLIDSDIEFVLTRHESGAAFMAGMVGRLTRRPGACLTTLGPGASNMVIGVGEAHLSYDPLVAMSGQVRRDCPAPRKQYIDLVSMFRPITKGSFTARSADQLPALTRRAFDLAAEERPGPVFMELPEDVLKERTTAVPLPPSDRKASGANDLGALRSLLASAERPLVLSGAGVLRGGAAKALRSFVSAWNIPAAMTWMGAGAVAFDDRLGLNTVGLRRADMVRAAFEEADLIIMVGFDLIEFEPRYWMVGREKKVAYIGAVPCDLVPGFQPNVEVVGDLRRLLSELSDRPSRKADWASGIRRQLHDSLAALPAEGRGVKPQHIIRAIRDCLGRKDIAVSDVGAHLIWMAQRYPVYEPHTMLVSNGLIPMGVGVPWAIAAKLVHPERKVVASVGDGSFAMTCMELETAKRLGTPFVCLVWSDASYELIRIRQEKAFGRSRGTSFGPLDVVKFAHSFGANGYRASSVLELKELMSQSLKDDSLTLIEVEVDTVENAQLLFG